MSEFTEYIIFGFSLVFSGVFSGSEAVIMSIPVNRTKQLIEKGGRLGRALEFMSQRPNDILTTILVGNNLVNILAASLTTRIAQRYFDNDALSISVGVTTILILVFGEIIPKTFARNHAESLAYPVIRMLQFFYYLLYPIVKSFMIVIKVVIGENVRLHGRGVTKGDIEFMVNRAEKEKSIDSKQIDLLTSILEFPKIKVKDIMVPRTKIQGIKKDENFQGVLAIVREMAHSRYPVFDEDLDDTLGVLHVKDLSHVRPEQMDSFDATHYIRPAFFVYEHMKIQAVFDHMNKKKVHLALVKDENGIVVGVVTLEDIIEEIFGEIQDEHDDEDDGADAHKRDSEDDTLVVAADISLRDLDQQYDIEIPLNDNYSTLAGFILDRLGDHFPEEGQVIFWEDYSFVLIKVENEMIQEVQIKSNDADVSIQKSSEEESEQETVG